MKPISFLILLAIGFFFTACNQDTNPTVTNEILDSIKKQQSDAWAQLSKDKDLRAMLDALYAPDAKFMAPNGPTVVGIDNIEATLKQFPPFNIDFTITHAEGSGDLVVLTPTYIMTAPDGSPMDEGKSIEVWKKQADGSWKIAYDMFNSSLPPPTLAQDHDDHDHEEGSGTESE